MPLTRAARGFTLIEILIVVAILTILAAIALPNMLEAQTRSKIARVRSDMRTLRTGLEAYRVDYEEYIHDWNSNDVNVNNDVDTWRQLTTPVAYLSSIPYSPFVSRNHHHNPYGPQEVYIYGGPPDAWYGELGLHYILGSPGPDQYSDFLFDLTTVRAIEAREPLGMDKLYDPTNGTLSKGDLLCSAKGFFN